MKLFIFLLAAAALVGGLVGAELTDTTFSMTGATVASIGTGVVVLTLGAIFDAQDRRRRDQQIPAEVLGAMQRLVALHASGDLSRYGAPKAPQDPVALTRSALRELERENAIPALHHFKPQVEAQLADRERTHISIVEERVPPRALVALLVSNVAFEELASGRYHTYRGVLSVAGKEIERAFVAACQLMVTLGFHSEAQHEEEMRQLRTVVKQAG